MSAHSNKNETMSLGHVNELLRALSEKTHAAFRKQNFKEAQHLLHDVLKIAPYQKTAWMDLASATLRLGEHELAYEYSLKCIHFMGNDVDPNVYDGLAEICHELGKTDEQIYYGRLAISLKKQSVVHESQWAFPSDFPAPFNPHNPQENIISYSLFGNLPRYGETAILNMQLAKEIYPEWTCRFYVDDSVPPSVLQRLVQQGAQVVQVNEQQKQMSGLYWRFFVMDDPTVKRFLIRDADSFLSYRERAAVDEWLNSSYWFHKMHDGYSHTELILAGMWGGCTGVFKGLHANIDAFIATGRYTNPRVMDQHYLRYCIWPTLKNSVLIHDRYAYNSHALAFPAHQRYASYEHDPKFHVGANEASAIIHIHFEHQLSERIVLFVKDQADQTICCYELKSDFKPQLDLQLPQYYAEKIKNDEWYITTQPKI
jgi:hypothetical protein